MIITKYAAVHVNYTLALGPRLQRKLPSFYAIIDGSILGLYFIVTN